MIKDNGNGVCVLFSRATQRRARDNRAHIYSSTDLFPFVCLRAARAAVDVNELSNKFRITRSQFGQPHHGHIV